MLYYKGVKMGKCLGCHNKLEDKYTFCSITCACLCGYFNVRTGWLKEPSQITQEEKDTFLNNPPVRGNYPDHNKN
jgi:hypothetical protein